jgi:hypothetical protein
VYANKKEGLKYKGIYKEGANNQKDNLIGITAQITVKQYNRKLLSPDKNIRSLLCPD